MWSLLFALLLAGPARAETRTYSLAPGSELPDWLARFIRIKDDGQVEVLVAPESVSVSESAVKMEWKNATGTFSCGCKRKGRCTIKSHDILIWCEGSDCCDPEITIDKVTDSDTR